MELPIRPEAKKRKIFALLEDSTVQANPITLSERNTFNINCFVSGEGRLEANGETDNAKVDKFLFADSYFSIEKSLYEFISTIQVTSSLKANNLFELKSCFRDELQDRAPLISALEYVDNLSPVYSKASSILDEGVRNSIAVLSERHMFLAIVKALKRQWPIFTIDSKTGKRNPARLYDCLRDEVVVDCCFNRNVYDSVDTDGSKTTTSNAGKKREACYVRLCPSPVHGAVIVETEDSALDVDKFLTLSISLYDRVPDRGASAFNCSILDMHNDRGCGHLSFEFRSFPSDVAGHMSAAFRRINSYCERKRHESLAIALFSKLKTECLDTVHGTLISTVAVDNCKDGRHSALSRTQSEYPASTIATIEESLLNDDLLSSAAIVAEAGPNDISLQISDGAYVRFTLLPTSQVNEYRGAQFWLSNCIEGNLRHLGKLLHHEDYSTTSLTQVFLAGVRSSVRFRKVLSVVDSSLETALMWGLLNPGTSDTTGSPQGSPQGSIVIVGIGYSGSIVERVINVAYPLLKSWGELEENARENNSWFTDFQVELKLNDCTIKCTIHESDNSCTLKSFILPGEHYSPWRTYYHPVVCSAIASSRMMECSLLDLLLGHYSR